MKTLIHTPLKAGFAAIAIMAFTATASAAERIDPITSGLTGIEFFDSEPDMRFGTEAMAPIHIGIARLDGRRLISAPLGETEDWHFLNKRTEARFTPISTSAYLKNVPEIAYGQHDTDNKLDEIRLTAADAGMDYVVVYSVGRDADWADLGGAALRRSEHIAPFSSAVYRNAEAKAVLMETHTGTVYGAVKADDAEFGVGDLTDAVQDMVETLELSLKPRA